MLILDGRRPRPTSKKNRRLVLADASQGGELGCEILHDPIPFSLAANVNVHFIALIHPIQWTIAYPVGADRPAKRQKKTSCVSTG